MQERTGVTLMDLGTERLGEYIRDIDNSWDMTKTENLSRNCFPNLVIRDGVVLFL